MALSGRAAKQSGSPAKPPFPINLESRLFRADDHGPRLLVTGGVHGDEFEPILAIRRLIRLFTGELLLFSHKAQEAVEAHLLDRLRGGPVERATAVIPRGVRIDADLID